MIGSCPECNGKLSSEATTCPHCGKLVSGKVTANVQASLPQVQSTDPLAKDVKTVRSLFASFIMNSIGMMVFGLILIGAALYFAGAIRAGSAVHSDRELEVAGAVKVLLLALGGLPLIVGILDLVLCLISKPALNRLIDKARQVENR